MFVRSSIALLTVHKGPSWRLSLDGHKSDPSSSVGAGAPILLVGRGLCRLQLPTGDLRNSEDAAAVRVAGRNIS